MAERPALPIDPRLPEILAAARERRAVVVVAPPGAGKTTRVAPALAEAGPVILLQPRRVAARSLARRIAAERGWTLGEEVGWQVRGERRFSPRTRLLVATEGILTARLQSDPLLSDFRTVVIDEFHERSQHADLALALSKQAARARGDLALVVMSATLDGERVAGYLGGCPLVRVEGRVHPVEIRYAPGVPPAAAAGERLAASRGHLLCFLPGAAEIRAATQELTPVARELGAALLPLHGRLSAAEQDAALAPSSQRKVILATNLAETSLTVEGVTDVIDSGLQRLLRHDHARGIDRLDTERVSRDSAEQRAGRAGRLGPGYCLRLWHEAERLRPHREPELARIDLAGPVLEVLAWGGDPSDFDWYETPPAGAVADALSLLERLGAVEGRRITDAGEAMRRFPLHPRLARVLVAAGGSRLAAAACAVLSERRPAGRTASATDCDLLPLIDALGRAPEPLRRTANELESLARRAFGAPAADDETALRRALFAGFADRLARRREPGSPRLLLASGHGARLAAESALREGDLLVTLDVAAGPRGPGSEALVRLASRVEPGWVAPTRRERRHRFEPESRTVRASEVLYYDRLALAERPISPDPGVAAALLVAELERRGPGPSGEELLRRAGFAGVSLELAPLYQVACAGRTELPEPDLLALLPHDVRHELERRAPERITIPSGRQARLEYRDDGAVTAAVKLQELFGLADTPKVGGRPVLLRLLAPNGRPVQTTTDLRSFWERTYPEVRKELRGRYPKHPWPEDPWRAEPTGRTRRR